MSSHDAMDDQAPATDQQDGEQDDQWCDHCGGPEHYPYELCHDEMAGLPPYAERRELADRLRSVFPDDRTSTHYAGCWRYHDDCAVLRAADVLAPQLSTDEQELLARAAASPTVRRTRTSPDGD